MSTKASSKMDIDAHDVTSGHRPVVIDVRAPASPHPRHRRQKRPRHHDNRPAVATSGVEPELTGLHYPLEMRPILQEALNYGRRTHSLGALRGVSALRQIATKIKQLALEHSIPELETISADAERYAEDLKNTCCPQRDDG